MFPPSTSDSGARSPCGRAAQSIRPCGIRGPLERNLKRGAITAIAWTGGARGNETRPSVPIHDSRGEGGCAIGHLERRLFEISGADGDVSRLKHNYQKVYHSDKRKKKRLSTKQKISRQGVDHSEIFRKPAHDDKPITEKALHFRCQNSLAESRIDRK
jgi:hypothetical protein